MKYLLMVVHLVVSIGGALSYNDNNVQYHIQTDEGPDRYFRFQTYNGQYRKEKRFDDGTVVGTYGWVDPTGLLRLFDYIADKQGYRIVRQRTIQKPIPTVPPPSASVTSPPRRRRPLRRRTTTTTSAPVTTAIAVTAAPSRSQQNLLSTADANKYTRRNKRPLPARQSVRRRPSQRQSVRQQLSGSASQVVPAPVSGTQSKSTSSSVYEHTSSSGSPVNDLLRTTAVDEVAGRKSIDYDLGNQFRKEKILPDGTKVGRHGYVDPLGILRVTYYASGPSGHDERQESRWVGTRTIGQLL